jgi:uncharacterized membrane protein
MFKILKVKFNDFWDLLLMSSGLSIFYLMFVGLAINQILPIFNINKPLSEFNILSIFTLLNLVLITINILDKNSEVSNKYNVVYHFNENKKNSLYAIFIVIINILFNIFAYIYEYDIIYILAIINLVFLYLIIVYDSSEENKNMYLLIIYVISFSLLLQTILSSKYIIGSDISIEYYVFKITKNNYIWDPFYFGPDVWIGIVNYNSMLSVTILPTIYSYFLNIKDDLIFKIIYPYMLSLVPLILVKIYNNYIKEFNYYSYIAALFLISDNTVFYGVIPLSLTKQITAVFFMLLFFLVLSIDDIKIHYKQILLIIFGLSITFSHYATSYIFIMFVVFGFMFNRFIFKDEIRLTTNVVLLLISTKIIWDSYVTIKTINQIYNLIVTIYIRFISDLLNPAARTEELSIITRQTTSIITIIHRIIFYLVHVFLSFGIVGVFIDKNEDKIKNIYKIFSLFSFLIILTAVLIPSLSVRFGLSRFRSISMFFLSPFIIIGYNSFINGLSNIKDIRNMIINRVNIISYKKRLFSILTLILVLYFLFNVGVVNYAFNDKPLSFTFDSERKKISDNDEILVGYYAQYKPEWDVFSTIWLSQNADSGANVYSDYVSAWHVLVSYGLMDNSRVDQLRNNTILREGNYIYLSYLNVGKDSMALLAPGMNRIVYNTTIFTPIFEVNNKIYSNGYSDVYLCTSNNQNRIVLKEEK